MSKFWKALGITALAAFVPVAFKKDEETGKKTYQSLLLSLDVSTDEVGKTADIGINIGDGVITNAITRLVAAKQEAELITDDPSEAVLFADDELTPAPADGPSAEVPAEEETSQEVTEEDFDPEA